MLWRIGFTGELSYELHVPASYGLHVWETLLERGRDLGVAPFGVEAQRILRLEKGHLIVGQDTDGLTRGFSAGLDWAIKLDKDDFLGKPELAWQARKRRVAAGRPAAGRRLAGAPRGEPDHRRAAHRGPHDLQPDVSHPGPVDLPGAGGRAPGRAGHRGHRAAAGRPQHRGRVEPQHAQVDPDGGRMRV